MIHSRKPLMILLFSLLFTGISVENALAHCLFSEFNRGNAISHWISLVLMSFMTASVFYLKFIYPRRRNGKNQTAAEAIQGNWENPNSIVKELKIGQNFSSWTQLNGIRGSGS